MKPITLLTALAACSLCAGTAFAKGTVPRNTKPPADEFKKLDTDHNGKLSKDEFIAGGHSAEEFDKLDKNKDGSLDRFEFKQLKK